MAGSLETILPELPLPSDPQVATNPLQRARSALAWSMALNNSIDLAGMKKGREVLKAFIG
jgi:hypothetical protein